MVERTEYAPEQIERRYATLDQRQHLYPTDLFPVSQIVFDHKFGKSQYDKLLTYLEKEAPAITTLPTTHSLINILFEASLDCRLAVYQKLNELVSIFNSNGDLEKIEDTVASVAKKEEELRRQKKSEEQQDYDTRVRIEAIKAVFKP